MTTRFMRRAAAVTALAPEGAVPMSLRLVGWEPPYDLVTKPAPEAVAGKPLLPPVPIFVDSADQAKAPPTTTTRRRQLPPPPPPPPARSKPVPGR